MSPLSRTGWILYVERYVECVEFYRDRLGLPVLFAAAELTCFELGGAYLMVEVDDRELSIDRSAPPRTCLRMNVPDVRAWADRLTQAGVEVDYQEHDWGRVAKFLDPDGNLCAFKDDETFEQQVRGGESA